MELRVRTWGSIGHFKSVRWSEINVPAKQRYMMLWGCGRITANYGMITASPDFIWSDRCFRLSARAKLVIIKIPEV